MRRGRDISDIVADEAERTIRWRIRAAVEGCILQIIIFVILAGIVGYMIFKVASGDLPAGVDPPTEVTREVERPGDVVWTGESPLTCGGNAAMEVRGVRAELPGQVAIVAQGNCSLTLVDVEVQAETALRVQGNAHVTIAGRSLLSGSRYAVEVTGNASATSRGATLDGGVDVTGNASFDQSD